VRVGWWCRVARATARGVPYHCRSGGGDVTSRLRIDSRWVSFNDIVNSYLKSDYDEHHYTEIPR
jgi:hypothetical protein